MKNKWYFFSYLLAGITTSGVLLLGAGELDTLYRSSMPASRVDNTNSIISGSACVGDNCTIIDVGGQDTKVILVENGTVQDFLMNDKCSAGTGKFLEIMANRLGITLQELFDMAESGTVLPISSLCTVFAESEVINYIGVGKNREDIAAGVVDSVASKVAQLSQKKALSDKIILTGGLSHSTYFTRILSAKIRKTVEPTENGRYAGALGAALLAKEKKNK